MSAGGGRRPQAGVVAVGCVLMMIIVAALNVEPGRQPSLAPPSAVSSPRFMLGDYGSPVVPADPMAERGAIDAPATIAALQTAHINTYAYVISPGGNGESAVSATQWAQLDAFAELAGSAGIEVYVYLLPPTEAAERAYAPYGWDYIAWFGAVGSLAWRRPAIRGIMIDDFGGNVRPRSGLGFHFTPEYVGSMVAAARRRADWLTFQPVLYRHDLFGASAMMPSFRPYVDGVVVPYLGYSDGKTVPGNTIDASQSLSQGQAVSQLLKCSAGSTCTQIEFSGIASVDPRFDSATLTRRLTPRSGQLRRLDLSMQDDSGATGRPASTIEVRIGTQQIASLTPVKGGWNHFTVDLSASTSSPAPVEVSLTVMRVGSPVGAVLLDDVHHTGFYENESWDTSQFEPAGATRADVVRSLPYIFMSYAIPLSAEHGVGATPTYLTDVMAAVGQLRTQRLVDGSMIFNLPLPGSRNTGDPRNFAVVQATYARWR